LCSRAPRMEMYFWSAMAGPPPQIMMSRNGGLSRPSANIGRLYAVSREAALPRQRLSVFQDSGQAQRTKNEQATDKTGHTDSCYSGSLFGRYACKRLTQVPGRTSLGKSGKPIAKRRSSQPAGSLRDAADQRMKRFRTPCATDRRSEA
jgi:hypothetical protein